MATTTVIGGDSITWSIPSNELSAASQALNQIAQGWPTGSYSVVTTEAAPAPGKMFVYNLSGGGTDNVPNSHSAIILADDLPTTVNAAGMQVLVVGNDAADSISISGTGTLYGPNGSESIGSGTVVVGNGNDTVTVKGDATVAAGNGNDSVTVQLGNASINVGTGNDTITLGGLNDTVTAAGAATVAGPGGLNATIGAGGGQLVFQNGAGGEFVMAGSGNVTLAGGSNQTFIGGTGNTVMQAVSGSGSDTFVGGAGSETMSGGGSGGNVFAFDTGTTPEGGTHVITNFVQGQDQIQLGSSYVVANILAGTDPHNTVLPPSGGSTTISLDSGQTIITLNNINHLSATDFK